MNGGTTWSQKVQYIGVNDILIDPANNRTIYAATNTSVYRTADGGETWTPFNDGLLAMQYTSLGINPDAFLFAGTPGAGIFRSSLTTTAVANEKSGLRGSNLVNARIINQNGRIAVHYGLTGQARVTLSVYDLKGGLVAVLENNRQQTGTHALHLDGGLKHNCAVARGLFFLKISVNGRVTIVKIPVVDR